jgi:hypothetical protein
LLFDVEAYLFHLALERLELLLQRLDTLLQLPQALRILLFGTDRNTTTRLRRAVACNRLTEQSEH